MDSRAATGKSSHNKYSSVVSLIATNSHSRPKVTVKKHFGPKIQITSRAPQHFVMHPNSSFSVPSVYIDEVTQSDEHIPVSVNPSTSQSGQTKQTFSSSAAFTVPMPASSNKKVNDLMAVYRTVNCGLQKAQVARTDDLRENLQLVESKLTNLEKRCMPKPNSNRNKVPPSNNSSASDVNSLNLGISETSVNCGRKPYDPSRYEEKKLETEEQSRKNRVSSVRMEIQQWKEDNKNKTGSLKSQSNMVKSGTGILSPSRVLSEVDKMDVEYKQLQNVALEGGQEGSWESVGTSRAKSSKVSIGIQSGDSSGASIEAGKDHPYNRAVEFTSCSRYRLDDYMTLMQPSPPRDYEARTTLNDIMANERTQRLLHEAKQTMFNLQADVSMEISNADVANTDLMKWNIQQLVNKKIQEILPSQQRHQQVMQTTMATVERIWPPYQPPTSSESLASGLHQDVLLTHQYMDNSFKIVQDVKAMLNTKAASSRSTSREKKKKKKKKPEATESNNKQSDTCGLHSMRGVQPSSNPGFNQAANAAVGEQPCNCCNGCRAQREQCGRVVAWDAPQRKRDSPTVRFVPVTGTTANAAVIEIKTLKNPAEDGEKDKTNNLIVQELPTMSIRTECAVQVGPSISLPSMGKIRPEENMGLIGVTHMHPLMQHRECETTQETPFLFDVNHADCVNRMSYIESVVMGNQKEQQLPISSDPGFVQESRIANRGLRGNEPANEPRESESVTMIAAKLEALEDRSLQQSNRMSEILKYLQNDIDLRLQQDSSVHLMRERERERMHTPREKPNRINSRRTGCNGAKCLHKKLAIKKSSNMLGNMFQTQQKQSPQKVSVSNELLKHSNIPDATYSLTKNLNNRRDERIHAAVCETRTGDVHSTSAAPSRHPAPVRDDCAQYLCGCGAAVRCALHLAARCACGSAAPSTCVCDRIERRPVCERPVCERPVCVRPVCVRDTNVCHSPRQSNVQPPVQEARIPRTPQEAHNLRVAQEAHISSGAQPASVNIPVHGHTVHYPENYFFDLNVPYRQGGEQTANAAATSPAMSNPSVIAWPVGSDRLKENVDEAGRVKRISYSNVGAKSASEHFNPSISTVLGVRQGNPPSSRYIVHDPEAAAKPSTGVDRCKRKLSVVTPYASRQYSPVEFNPLAGEDVTNPNHACVVGARLFHLLGIPGHPCEAQRNNVEQGTTTSISLENLVHGSLAAGALLAVNTQPGSTLLGNRTLSTETQQQNVPSEPNPLSNENRETNIRSSLLGVCHDDDAIREQDERPESSRATSEPNPLLSENCETNIRSSLFGPLDDDDAIKEQDERSEFSRTVPTGAATLPGLVGERSMLDRQLEMMRSEDLELLRKAMEAAFRHRKEKSGELEEAKLKEREEEMRLQLLTSSSVWTNLEARDFDDNEGRLAVIKEVPDQESREKDRSDAEPSASENEEVLTDELTSGKNVTRADKREKRNRRKGKKSMAKKAKGNRNLKLRVCKCSPLISSADEHTTDHTASSSSMSEGEVRSFGEVRNVYFNLDERSERSVGEVRPGKQIKCNLSVGEMCSCGSACEDISMHMKPKKL